MSVEKTKVNVLAAAQSPFEFLYCGRPLDVPNYSPPEKFCHGNLVLVATCPKTSEDGHDVEVYEVRYPATFFTIKVLPTQNSVGIDQPGWSMSTGSGAHAIVSALVREICNGMIGLDSQVTGAQP
jgi:hypothetical protein